MEYRPFEKDVMIDTGKFIQLEVDDAQYQTFSTRKFEKRKGYIRYDAKKIHAFIPGMVVQLCCEVGQTLKEGDTLLVLEAMKMRNAILASCDGTVRGIFVKTGDKVAKGKLLLEMK
jgi:biotin carboxyl carrier protein